MSSLSRAASRGGGGKKGGGTKGKSSKRSAAATAAASENQPDTTSADTASGEQFSLPKLLSALALGVRAANGLPKPSTRNPNASDSEEGGEDGDDDFAYLMAFPEFASKCHEGRAELSVLLSDVLRSVQESSPSSADDMMDDDMNGGAGDDDEDFGFESPVLWEKAAEACESLLEEVDSYVQSLQDSATATAASSLTSTLESAAAKAREKSKSSYGLMMSGIVDMEKPQNTYPEAFANVNNSRIEPFKPEVHPDKPHGIVALAATLRPVEGHGLETRNGDLASSNRNGAIAKSIPDDIVAPDVHYPHQYEQEIQSLQYREWQLAVESDDRLGKHGIGGTLNRLSTRGVPTEKGYWIDTESDLAKLVGRINDPSQNVREIAVDLEAHSHRSFGGITCLMQLSLRRNGPNSGSDNTNNHNASVETASDFLIDTIALRSVMNRHLAAVFADPDIVKVMHGADSDIPWLQRDFGIYVVNLFDTGRAARALPHFSSAGLAYLLGRYAGVEADKKHQLSDWRQRPLPDEMAAYATSDTTYLLDIYDRVKLELQSHPDPDSSITSVLNDSKKVCLIRYDKEPFRPSGYTNIISSKRNKRKRSTSLYPRHESVLKEVYDWRDRTARDLDESLHYISPNSALLRIATMCPRTVGALQGLINPCPPLVVRCSDEILRLIKQAFDSVGSKTGPAPSPGRTKPVASSPEKISLLRASASPFAFKPADEGDKSSPGSSTNERDLPPRPSDRQNSGMMSPVVGTDALFKQAGWMTPQGDPMEMDGHTSTEDESDSGKKRRQLLSVDKANENYVANKYSRHSLEMGSAAEDGSEKRARTVDGLGAAREALGQNSSGDGTADGDGTSLQSASMAAQTNADKIQKDLLNGNHGLLNLASGDKFGICAATVPSPSRSETSERSDGLYVGENDPIPRSMKEIYYISNRNRAGAVAPVPVQEGKPEAVFDVDTLEGAEAKLATSGPEGRGFEKNAIGLEAKKQKRPEGTKEIPISKEEDIGLMTSIGWIKDEAEAFEMMAERHNTSEDKEKDKDKPQSGEDTKVVVSKADGGGEGDSGFVSKSKKRGGGGGSNQRGKSGGDGTEDNNTTREAFDYSKVGSIGAYGPKGAPTTSNPFFAGAAVSGGTLSGGSQPHKPRRRKRGKGGGGGGGGGNSGGGNSGERIGRRDAGNKTTVYRGGQR